MSEKVTEVNTQKTGKIDIFHKRLKQARIDAGFTSQDAFADKVGVNRVTINYYEQGIRKPDIEVFIKIADALNVSYDYLLGYSDTPIREYHDTKEITGLCDSPIKTLNDLVIELKSEIGLKEHAINKLKTINLLLEHESDYPIFSTISNFFFRTYNTFDFAGNEMLEVPDKSGNINFIPVSDLYNVELLEIEKQLNMLKDFLEAEKSSTPIRKKK